MRDFFQYRRYLVASMQAVFIVLTYALACAVVSFQLNAPGLFLETVWLVLAIKLLVFHRFGLFSGWWCYVGMNDAFQIALASGSSSILLFILLFPFRGPATYLIAVLFVDLVLTTGAVAGSRFAVRAYTEAATRKYPAHRNTLIVGAGTTGSELARNLVNHPDLDYKPVGFVDDDPTKRGLKIHGIPVLGATSVLPDLCALYRVDCVMVAIPSVGSDILRLVLDVCSANHLEFKIVPTLAERLNGSAFTLLRDVAMEDLLGREPVRLDLDNIRKKFEDKVVLITGAGGSIGSELVRQSARFSPKQLILFDRSENDLFKLSHELQRHFPSVNAVPCIGDISDVRTLRDVFARNRVNSVFHAAAYKHVPMMENNCLQAVSNNIFGTYNTAVVSRDYGVEDFIMISTDKAVNPTSVMGVTKRIAELVVLSLQGGKTRFTAVRFGNVLGSNGSVVPLFREQIAAGGPVTVTHPNALRYFMTVSEAVQLVLQASAMGIGDEIFVLDMGKPVSILEVARHLIKLAAMTDKRQIEIVFTGLRPGEKLFEELRLQDEGLLPTPHAKIRVLKSNRVDVAQMLKWLDELSAILATRNVSALLLKLKEIVPTYVPSRELTAMCEIDRYDQSWEYLSERANLRSTAVA